MQKIWQIKDVDPKRQTALSNALNIHPIIAQLLINRDIVDVKDAQTFLSADLSALHDPFLLKDMAKAVQRIQRARKDKERVLVFGDYDVDGVTSSALLNNVLAKMGITVFNHIPHRVHDGYGLNHDIGAVAKQKGVSLLITVDCGISACDEVETLNRLGIEVIVVDHHEASENKLPDALAIINPKQKDCQYPFKELASVGLVAKLAQALLGELSEDALDLVAIGTIADVVPLRGENRIFVKVGLPKITATKNKGLSALLDVAKINKAKKISPFHVGFILGPRINAAGRMNTAHESLDLLLSEESEEAYNLARILDKHNANRQKMQRDIVQEAFEIVEQEVNFKDEKVIVLSKEGWHKGVLGIVASRITDKYYRPAVVISVKDGVGTASARSIDGFHLHDALQDCAGCLENFGGHEGAAGLTILEENIDPFKILINDVAHKTLDSKKLTPVIPIDCEILLSSINMDLAEIIDSMEPFGEGNPSPIFCSRQVSVKSQPAVLGKDTLKFWVADDNISISAVGFGMAKYKALIRPGHKIDLAYQISIDDWNKSPTPQLKLKDIRVSDG
jgi:single-stranded-DNA-specific exonuclease